jgi:hypothetical protein
MDNVDEQVLAVVQRYTDEQKTLTHEGIQFELPSVDMQTIKASLQRLQDQGTVVAPSLFANVPYIEKD